MEEKDVFELEYLISMDVFAPQEWVERAPLKHLQEGFCHWWKARGVEALEHFLMMLQKETESLFGN